MSWISKQNLPPEVIQNPSLMFWLSQPNLSKTISNRVHFSLEVISESFNSFFQAELALISVERTPPFVREVVLKGNHLPLIFARVTMPVDTYFSYQKELEGLGATSIGEHFLYKHPHQRSSFKYKWLTMQQLSTQESLPLMTNFQGCWTRRSVFKLEKGKLLITEGFMPPILEIASI